MRFVEYKKTFLLYYFGIGISLVILKVWSLCAWFNYSIGNYWQIKMQFGTRLCVRRMISVETICKMFLNFKRLKYNNNKQKTIIVTLITLHIFGFWNVIAFTCVLMVEPNNMFPSNNYIL